MNILNLFPNIESYSKYYVTPKRVVVKRKPYTWFNAKKIQKHVTNVFSLIMRM